MNKFKIWDSKKQCYVNTNCGRFLLDQNGKLWFKEELPASDGRLEEVPEHLLIVWHKGE